MKHKFTKQITFTPAWNGNDKLPADEQVKVKISVMTFADLMAMLDAMRENVGADGKPEAAKVLMSAGALLSKYAQVDNLMDDDGPVDVAKVVNYSEYISLAMEIMLKLSAISTPGDNDAGN